MRRQEQEQEWNTIVNCSCTRVNQMGLLLTSVRHEMILGYYPRHDNIRTFITLDRTYRLNLTIAQNREINIKMLNETKLTNKMTDKKSFKETKIS